MKNVTVSKIPQQVQQSGGRPDLWDIEEIPPEPPTRNTSFLKSFRRAAAPRPASPKRASTEASLSETANSQVSSGKDCAGGSASTPAQELRGATA